MKTYLVALILLASCSISFGQDIDYNLKGGFIADGYDLVSYFSGEPMEGKKEFSHSYKNIKLKFSSQSNLDLFKSEPEKYIPEYGGWCAYAIGAKGKKIKIDPETYEILDNKLYLFYNSWGTNGLESWREEGSAQLKEKADINWEKIKY